MHADRDGSESPNPTTEPGPSIRFIVGVDPDATVTALPDCCRNTAAYQTRAETNDRIIRKLLNLANQGPVTPAQILATIYGAPGAHP